MAPTICSEKNFSIRQNRLRVTTNNSNSNFKQLNSNTGNLKLSKRLRRTRKNKGFTNKFTQINLPENNSLSLTTSSNESINDDNSIHSQSSYKSATSISTTITSTSDSTPTFLLEQIYNENSNKINYCNEQSSLSSDLINQTKIFHNNNLIKNNNNENINKFINNIYVNDNEQTFSSEEDNEVKMILQDKCNFETIKLSSRIKYQRNQRIYMENEKQRRNSFGLVEIALKTIKLIRRNQVLQKRLQQLQLETNQFIRSVLQNPENQNIYNNQIQNNNN